MLISLDYSTINIIFITLLSLLLLSFLVIIFLLLSRKSFYKNLVNNYDIQLSRIKENTENEIERMINDSNLNLSNFLRTFKSNIELDLMNFADNLNTITENMKKIEHINSQYIKNLNTKDTAIQMKDKMIYTRDNKIKRLTETIEELENKK